LTGPLSPSNETVPSSDQPSAEDINSPFSFLPRWAAKMIEAARLDVGDVSSSRQTHSHKQQASVALMALCVFLRLVILSLTHMHKENLNGNNLCKMI